MRRSPWLSPSACTEEGTCVREREIGRGRGEVESRHAYTDTRKGGMPTTEKNVRACPCRSGANRQHWFSRRRARESPPSPPGSHFSPAAGSKFSLFSPAAGGAGCNESCVRVFLPHARGKRSVPVPVRNLTTVFLCKKQKCRTRSAATTAVQLYSELHMKPAPP